MATQKQRQAARKNVRKAISAAKSKHTIAHMPKRTRAALGKQAAAVAQRKRSGSTRPKTGPSYMRWRRGRTSPAGRKWAARIWREHWWNPDLARAVAAAGQCMRALDPSPISSTLPVITPGSITR